MSSNAPAQKHDADKTRFSTIDRDFPRQLATVKMKGAERYGERNYMNAGQEFDVRLADACIRHLFAFLDGETTDPDWGLSHLAHAAANLEILFERNK